MTFYIIRNSKDGKFCYENTPYGDHSFALENEAPHLFKSVKSAKSSLTRGINNCKYSGNATHNKWFEYLLAAEIIEVNITMTDNKVIHLALFQIGK